MKNTGFPGYRYTKIHAYILVPRSFMKFMFSTVYRVTQKDFYARPYTSMWAPVVARQISKRYSSSCHVFISIWGVISSTSSMIRCLKSTRYLSNFSPVHNVLKGVVYRRKVREIHNLADLRQRIIETVELITPHMLINTWQELEYSLDICRATTGAHIEVYGRA